MQFRPAKKSEYKVIAGFQQKMAKETEHLQLNTDTVLRGVQTVFNDPSKGKYFVVEDDGKVIASLLTTYEWSDWRNSTVLWIQSVYVLESYRRKGIFKIMYENIKEIVKNSSDYSGIRLYVDKTNVIAQMVYNNLGMEGEHYKLYEDMQ